jgi:transcriptional regulator with XRE-family HTH domain
MLLGEDPTEIGRYRILDRLGEGYAGVVFLATPTEKTAFARPGELLALKVYKDEVLRDPKEKERIEKREFAVGSAVAHPNVVRIHDHGRDSTGRPFLVMEYVDGQTLSSWVQMYHPLSDPVLLEIACQILDGVAALHSVDAIHRDLKPSNIMISEAFRVKVMDLGVVLVTKDKAADLTPSSQFLGTIRNSSPELLLGRPYDKRTDMYSFGTLLYHLLHGEEVFAQEQQFARLTELVLHNPPEFDESLTGQGPTRSCLLELCKRLLNKNPSERIGSAQEVQDILRGQRRDRDVECRPVCAYIAAALTGLSAREREAITFLGHSVAKACKVLNIYAHQPRKATDPILHPGLPPEAVYFFDRRRVVNSDLVIAICNEPSFGVGQELEIAAAYGIPTLLVKREGVSVSRMITGSLLNLLDEGPLEYGNPDELERKLTRLLRSKVAHLRKRREAVRADEGAQLSQRLRELRRAQGWNVEEAAERYGISPRYVRMMENNPDYFHNAGIAVLTRVARAHGQVPSDLLSSLVASEPVRPAGAEGTARLIRVVNEVAVAEHWPTEDVVAIQEEYLAELAAKGRAPDVGRQEVHDRHEALLRRRLEESGKLF